MKKSSKKNVIELFKNGVRIPCGNHLTQYNLSVSANYRLYFSKDGTQGNLYMCNECLITHFDIVEEIIMECTINDEEFSITKIKENNHA